MPNDFSVADVLAWARTKPADETYEFTSAGTCALGQYAREVAGASAWEACCGIYESRVPRELMRAANMGNATFGKFVARLEAIVQETKPTPWLNPQTYLDADVGEHV